MPFMFVFVFISVMPFVVPMKYIVRFVTDSCFWLHLHFSFLSHYTGAGKAEHKNDQAEDLFHNLAFDCLRRKIMPIFPGIEK